MENPWSTDRYRIPNSSLKTIVRLSKTLLLDMPDVQEPSIVASAGRLEAQVNETDVALATRFRETNQIYGATEVEFDRASDITWIWVRRLLEGWSGVYSHPGLDALPAAVKVQIDLPKMRDKGKRAQELYERLFGAMGTNWTNANFIEQSETMATILRVIKQDELGDDLASIVGDELPKLLEIIQVQYEDMVSARMVRERGPSDNLRVLRERLRFRLDHYKNAVESLRDPEDPESHKLVDRALRALILLNQRVNSGATTQELEEFADAELVELEYEQDQAPISADEELPMPEPEPPAIINA